MKTNIIFTEIEGCGKIGNIALKSFRKHHPKLTVKVFGSKKDFDSLEVKDGFELIELNTISWGKDVIEGYKQGHLGTAILWTHLIKEYTSVDNLIHFDSDVVFRGNLIDDIITYSEDFQLVGGRRLYCNNLQYTTNMVGVPDVVSTSSFSFNRKYVDPMIPFDLLVKKLRGMDNSGLNHRVLDFFDPISFMILNNNGKVKYLDWNDVGGCDTKGSRDNIWSKYNNGSTPFKIEFGNKIVHFSATGSGMNFYHNKESAKNVPKPYTDYALDRYALFCKIFYNEDIGIDVSKYNSLIEGNIKWF